MDTKGPINPPSKQNSYIHVKVDAFSHFVVTRPVEQNKAQNAVNSLLHLWTSCISSYRPDILILSLQIFVPQGESGIHQELFMHHGQLV